ncbi:MAG: diguanylate cyclase [Pseudomonadota bacterium]
MPDAQPHTPGSIRVRDFLSHLMTSLVPGELLAADWVSLVSPRPHSDLLARRRGAMVVSHVRLLAFLFAVLTPLWSVIDYVLFPYPLWFALAAMRLCASAGFGFLAFYCRPGRGMADAYRALAALFAIPTLFYIASHVVLSWYELHGLANAVRAGYAFLPFVLLAGLSMFPLTLVENLVIATPILIAQALSAVAGGPFLGWPSFAGAFWLLFLLTGVSILAGMSQLAFLIVLVRQAAGDPLTGTLSRRSAEEILELQFNVAARSETPLSVAFIDLDRFKSINDGYGHETGDAVLAAAARALEGRKRAADVLARWGGEEFILIMPHTSLPQARMAIDRLRDGGFGIRPDGGPVTASIGMAERIEDRTPDWRSLVAVADRRMYRAKQEGRNRVVGDDEAASPSSAGKNRIPLT